MNAHTFKHLLADWEDKNTLAQLRDGYSWPLLPFFALANAALIWSMLALGYQLDLVSFDVGLSAFAAAVLFQVVPAGAARWLKRKFPD